MLASDTEEGSAGLHNMLKKGESVSSMSWVPNKSQISRRRYFKLPDIEIQDRHNFGSELCYDSLVER